MDWNFDEILWPTVYMLWTVGIIFFVWAMLRRKRKKNHESWQLLLAVSLFCGATSLIMLIIHWFGLELSFSTRLGIVSLILCTYAYYSYKRQRK